MGFKLGDISPVAGMITGKGMFGKGLAAANKILGPAAGIAPRMAASAQKKTATKAQTKAEMANSAGSMGTAPATRKPLGAMKSTTPSAPPIMSNQPMSLGKQISQGQTTGYGSFRNTPSGSAETMIKKSRELTLGGGSDSMSNRENTKDF
jgi:hypothetical protein